MRRYWVLDMRGNDRAGDSHSDRWLTRYTGRRADRHFAWGIKFSEFNRHLYQTVGGHPADEIPGPPSGRTSSALPVSL